MKINFMQKEIRVKIGELIAKYEQVKQDGKLKAYTEEETKKEFILPLFDALEWKTTDRDEVSAEEHIKSSGRVDYGFYLNGRAKFYLEAKSLKTDIYNEDFADQAIRYSWNRGATWAILTNFEHLIVFNAQDIEQSLAGKKLFDIPYDKYLELFDDQLQLLSKHSFAEDLIDKYAEKIGKKLQKVLVTSLLWKDLQKCRDILTEHLAEWNGKIDRDLLDEGVQKLLDRLIFLRVAEDRGIEPLTLIPMIRQWEAGGRKEHLYQSMIKKFRELNEIYDSNLFLPHPFEQWEEYSDATEKVANILYGKKGYYEYDFKVMPADVLGSVYENYLSYRLSKSKKGVTVDKDAKKRKERGIYYTPSFIVDYIVRNALGPVLDKCESVGDLKKIKVLDPACGSGSFLVKALDLIYEKYLEFGNPGDEYTKLTILIDNIYGVDLDEQAVEIARLNLLISALDHRMQLPKLDKNIKNGNSLISGTDEELKKYFGKNFRDKKPFNWEEEFSEVFTQGGFDVIIGNPPYIKEYTDKSAFDGLHNSPYYQGKTDIWTMFACVSIDLLKRSGLLGFIAPNNWVSNAGASIFRDKILQDGELKSFVDFGDYKVFKEAGIQTMIFVFEKGEAATKYKVDYFKILNKEITEDKLISELFGEKEKITIEPKKLIGGNVVFSRKESNSIFDKMCSKKNFEVEDDEISNGIHHHHDVVNKERREILGDNFSVGDGIFVLSDNEKKSLNFNKKELELIKPSYATDQLGRWYGDPHNKEWVIYTDSSFKDSDKIVLYPNIKRHLDKFKSVITSDNKPYGLHRAKNEKFFKGEKIVALRKCLRPTFTYVNFDSYISATFYIIKTERVNQKYLVAILNSKLIAYWLKHRGKMQGNNYQLDKEPLVGIPICIGDTQQQKATIVLVDKMLGLQKELHSVEKNSNKWESLKSEIEKTDNKIDEEVYKLYGLTPEEIKIVEGGK